MSQHQQKLIRRPSSQRSSLPCPDEGPREPTLRGCPWAVRGLRVQAAGVLGPSRGWCDAGSARACCVTPRGPLQAPDSSCLSLLFQGLPSSPQTGRARLIASRGRRRQRRGGSACGPGRGKGLRRPGTGGSGAEQTGSDRVSDPSATLSPSAHTRQGQLWLLRCRPLAPPALPPGGEAEPTWGPSDARWAPTSRSGGPES